MSNKATWRTAAWMSAGILTVTYILFVPVEIPPGDGLFTFGYKVGFGGALISMAWLPAWLTRVIENRLRRTNAQRDVRLAE